MSTDPLHTRPSLLSGIARLFDFWGLFDNDNLRQNEPSADARALASDWHAVGADLRWAMDSFSDLQPDPVSAPVVSK